MERQTPLGDPGAFERFLSSAFATIIAIIFSWRILLELEAIEVRENVDREQQEDNNNSKEYTPTRENRHGDNVTVEGLDIELNSNNNAGSSDGSDNDQEDMSSTANMADNKSDKSVGNYSIRTGEQQSVGDKGNVDNSSDSTTSAQPPARYETPNTGSKGRSVDIRQRVRELTSSSAPQLYDLSSSPSEDYYCLSSLDPELTEHADSVLAYERFMREHGSDVGGCDSGEGDGRQRKKIPRLDLEEIERQLAGMWLYFVLYRHQ